MKNFLIALLIGYIITFVLASIIGLSFEPFKWTYEVRVKFVQFIAAYSLIVIIIALAKAEMDRL